MHESFACKLQRRLVPGKSHSVTLNVKEFFNLPSGNKDEKKSDHLILCKIKSQNKKQFILSNCKKKKKM